MLETIASSKITQNTYNTVIVSYMYYILIQKKAIAIGCGHACVGRGDLFYQLVQDHTHRHLLT